MNELSGGPFDDHDAPEQHADDITAAIVESHTASSMPRPTVSELRAVLDDRQRSHGDFDDTAALSQAFKSLLHGSLRWPSMSAIEREGAEMAAVKLARILAGDPHCKEHWGGLAEYARLVGERLT